MFYMVNSTALYTKASSSNSTLKAQIDGYKAIAASSTYQKATKFLTYFEAKFKCSGLCKPGFFYLTRPISDGRPTTTCMTYLKNAIGDNLTYLGIVSLVAGIITFLTFLMQYCLWRKFDD
jgi:hypothetical protein